MQYNIIPCSSHQSPPLMISLVVFMIMVRLLLALLARSTKSTLAAQFYYSISRVTLPAVVDNHWMAIVEIQKFCCHTTTAHESQILRNQLAYNWEINWLIFWVLKLLNYMHLSLIRFYMVQPNIFFIIIVIISDITRVIIRSGSAVYWKHMADRVPHGDRLFIWRQTVGKCYRTVWCGHFTDGVPQQCVINQTTQLKLTTLVDIVDKMQQTENLWTKPRW